MKLSSLKVFLCMVPIYGLTGCGWHIDEIPNPAAYSLHWSPNDISVTCASDEVCPAHQGALLAVTRSEYSLTVYRCTGSIYSEHHVISAGHCVEKMKSADEIFFKTAEKPGRPSRLFHVQRPQAGSSWVDNQDTLVADYGYFELVEPAAGIEFVHPALTIADSVREFLALVVNAAQEDHLRLDSVTCAPDTLNFDFLAYDKHPTVFKMRDCKIVGGNSGGIVVQKTDLNAVLGIVYASNYEEQEKGGLGRLPGLSLPYGSTGLSSGESKVMRATATNARCISLPGWPRVQQSCFTMSKSALGKAVRDSVLKSPKLREMMWTTENRLVKAPSVDAHLRLEPLWSNYQALNPQGDSSQQQLIVPLPTCIEHPPAFENGSEAPIEFPVEGWLFSDESNLLTPDKKIPMALVVVPNDRGLYNVRLKIPGDPELLSIDSAIGKSYSGGKVTILQCRP